MSPGPGRLQPLRGPHGQLGVEDPRVVHIAVGGDRKPLRGHRHSDVPLPPHGVEIPHVQPGGGGPVHWGAPAAHRHRGRLLGGGVLQLRH